MEDENREQPEKKSAADVLFDLKRKSENIWYHYKLSIIAGAAFLALIIFCAAQCASRIAGDADVAYIGMKQFNDEEYSDLRNNLNDILGEDLNGDKKINVDFSEFLCMTDVQIENARAAGEIIDVKSLMTAQAQLQLEIADGNIIIYFIDPEVYKQLKKSGGINIFMALEDALGYAPEKSFDECALRLSDLYCWEYYAGIGSIPDNTLVVVRDRQAADINNKNIDEKYERNLLMFRRLVEFSAPGKQD